MANPSKRKGTGAEVAVRDHLRANGYPYAERLACEGSKDRGDISGVPGVVVEVKSTKAHDLAGWLAELDAEMTNANVDIGVVWAKKRGTTNPGDWYVITTGDVFLRLLDPPLAGEAA